MGLKTIIEKNVDTPLDELIPKMGFLLFNANLLIPLQGEIAEDEDGCRNVPLLTGQDEDGEDWLYLYSNEEELLKNLPEGTQYVEMAFADIFHQLAPNFRGMYINNTLPLPKEIFPYINYYSNKE